MTLITHMRQRLLLWCACLAAGLAIEVPVGVPRAPSQPGHDQHYTPAPELSFCAPFEAVNPFIGERYLDQWELGGAAMVHRNFARLTSDAQGHRGWIFNRVPVNFESWSAVLKFRVSGRSTQLFGDGLALWFSKRAEHVPGEVFGREDMWEGLGIFFDTFQNIDKAHHHKHPYISVISNDGTHHYEPGDYQEMGTKARSRHAVPGKDEGSGCSFDFRYSEMRDDFSVQNATLAHIQYHEGRVKIQVRQTAADETDWVDCIDTEVGELSGNHYFGFSAATGDLVDNHDVLAFKVYDWTGVPDLPLQRARVKAVEEMDASMLDLMPARPMGAPTDVDTLVEEQAKEIQRLRSHLALLQHRLEYELTAVHRGIGHAKQLVEDQKFHIDNLKYEVTEGMHHDIRHDMDERIGKVSEELREDMERKGRGFGWKWWFLLVLIVALFAYGQNRYNKIMKTHFL